ncbi:MAG TPA: hypothetical protein VLT89_04005 [Usitatibacter sp.]|nr:hypothetical protein [Usitatibacter sp.]
MRTLLIALAAASAAAAFAAPPAGRWIGEAQIPYNDMPLVLDLAQDASGAWIGSLTSPGFEIKGAALGNLKVAGDTVSFDIGNVLGAPPDGPATFSAKFGKDRMAGEMRQAGNKAPFELKLTGTAQVDLPPKSTAIGRELEGRWVGTYELGGYPRQVTVDLANQPGSTAKVGFVVVGKMTTNVPVDFISEKDGTLRFESSAYRTVFEGVIGPGQIKGTLVSGPFEVPLILRRPTEKAS